MNHFEHRQGRLHAEDVAIADIARAVGTPFYCYSTATIERHYRVFAESLAGLDATICYAVKANDNIAVIRTLARLGAGADVVSEGELRRAIAAGVPPAKIVFSGVGKTRAEMAYALKVGIGQFNVESEPELDALDEVATAAGQRAAVALRVNPDVEAHTHDKIATGRKHDKFGIDIETARRLYARASNMRGIEPVGLAVHIGSQLTSLAPFRAAFERMAELVRELRAEGLAIRRLDLGGGLGIIYQNESPPPPEAYGRLVREVTEGLGVALEFEPGRLIVGNAGVLVASVIYVKRTPERRFVIVDAAMNDLIRPTLYGARHRVTPVARAAGVPQHLSDVVGPVCETGDILAKDVDLPDLAPGDLLAIESTGAYGAVMASTYNTRLPVAEVLVNRDQFYVIRPRPTYRDLISLDRVPDWLGES
jgi:diaminopimelate decarboxylase